jgi:hypothetical protein
LIISENIIVAIIVSTPPTLIGLATLWTAMQAQQKVQELHMTVNSKMDRLLAVTATASHAEGVLEGKASRDAQLPEA